MSKLKGRRVSSNVKVAPPYQDRARLSIGTKSLIGMAKEEIRQFERTRKKIPAVVDLVMDQVDEEHRNRIDPVRKAARLKKMYNRSDHK